MAPPKKFDEKLRESFNALDADSNGKITKPELAKLVGAVFGFKQGQVPSELVDVVMEYADKDKSGYIGIHELEDAVACLQGLVVLYQLEVAFREMDKDGNGFLTKDELMQLVKGQTKGQDKEAVSKMLQHMDTDGDGKISREEFIKSCCNSLVVQKK